MAKSKYGADSKIVWKDRKRFMGLPLSFTKYSIVENESWVKLFKSVGLLSTSYEEVHAYRIIDISLKQSLGDKIFGVGTIILHCDDPSNPYLYLTKVKHPFEVRNTITKIVEREKALRGFRITEFHG